MVISRPFMTADGRRFATREAAIQHIMKMQRGRTDWVDYIYLGGKARWRVYESGTIEDQP